VLREGIVRGKSYLRWKFPLSFCQRVLASACFFEAFYLLESWSLAWALFRLLATFADRDRHNGILLIYTLENFLISSETGAVVAIDFRTRVLWDYYRFQNSFPSRASPQIGAFKSAWSWRFAGNLPQWMCVWECWEQECYIERARCLYPYILSF
jgi:hypothetical protein